MILEYLVIIFRENSKMESVCHVANKVVVPWGMTQITILPQGCCSWILDSRLLFVVKILFFYLFVFLMNNTLLFYNCTYQYVCTACSIKYSRNLCEGLIFPIFMSLTKLQKFILTYTCTFNTSMGANILIWYSNFCEHLTSQTTSNLNIGYF